MANRQGGESHHRAQPSLKPRLPSFQTVLYLPTELQQLTISCWAKLPIQSSRRRLINSEQVDKDLHKCSSNKFKSSIVSNGLENRMLHLRIPLIVAPIQDKELWPTTMNKTKVEEDITTSRKQLQYPLLSSLAAIQIMTTPNSMMRHS